MPSFNPRRRRATIRSVVLYHAPDSPHLHHLPCTITGVELHNGQYRYWMWNSRGPMPALLTAAQLPPAPRQPHTPWRARISAIYHAAADRDLPWDDLHPLMPMLYIHIRRNERTRAMTTLRALERQVGIRPTTRRR